ncbi:MAG: Gfo/Idh/MocA family oxidoreductase [Anaerolineae bacterium]
MKQVLLDGRGQIHAVEVPAPALEPGHVLVRTAYSLISSGTELATIGHHSTSPVQRALARPELIRTLAQQALRDGLRVTRDRVADRLNAWVPIGYSLAGTVLEVGSGVSGLKPGDRVACVGAEYAYHAEYVAVPAQLAIPVPKSVAMATAAFAAVGAVALHGVRRGGLALGETAGVIGLGLVGLLAVQLLKAAGCHVLGMDPNPARCQLAKRLGCDATATTAGDMLSLVVGRWSFVGADAVIITAATENDEPIALAADICREKGRVVVVGAVGMKIQRGPFYRKELDLIMCRSLGPGRYDPSYEQDGHDYPLAYVRWTEGRNVEAFLRQVEAGRVDPSPLVSAEFPVEEAPAAYARLATGDDTLAVLLRHGPMAEEGASALTETWVRRVAVRPTESLAGRIGVGLIGAGNFARAVHLPLLRRSPDFVLRGIVGRRGPEAHHTARQFGAAYAATDLGEFLGDPEIQVIWITTPHDSHADLAVQALEAGKHVFVEKPLALTLADCWRVVETVRSSGRLISVGFNRRFAPASQIVRRHFADVVGPKEVLYRVRADALPEGHWLDDPERGGGRLLGEGCHFFDWLAWFLAEEPIRISAVQAPGTADRATIAAEFANGSVGTLLYTCAGAPGMPKERIEVFGNGHSAVIDDFQAVQLGWPDGHWRRRRAVGKGYDEQLATFVQVLRDRASPAVTAFDGLRATACALAALAAIRERRPQLAILQGTDRRRPERLGDGEIKEQQGR